jgi:hypothetical protein
MCAIEEAGCQSCVLLKRQVVRPMFFEEAGCQARRSGLLGPLCLKKWVVKPVFVKEVGFFVEEAGCQAREHSLQVRELLGIDFPRCQVATTGL